MILWTPWLPWWTTGLLGKCVRNCRTLCPESGHVHSSSWTWTVEWPRSGKLVMLISWSFSQKIKCSAEPDLDSCSIPGLRLLQTFAGLHWSIFFFFVKKMKVRQLRYHFPKKVSKNIKTRASYWEKESF